MKCLRLVLCCNKFVKLVVLTRFIDLHWPSVAVVLMGKNTMMRKAIRGHLENNPALEK